MNFAYKLRNEIQRDLFSQQDLKTLFYCKTDAAIHSGLTRSLTGKQILKLKRGLYLFSKNLRRRPLSNFLVANKLYDPSYVSFESALSFHGLIPEAVYRTTSACIQRKNKIFTTELGDFSFDHIPSRPFFIGVTSDSHEGGALVANAIKALFDLIYLRRKNYPSIEDLQSDLRIEQNLLKTEVAKYSSLELEILAKSYKKKAVYQFYTLLMRTFK